MCRHVIRGHMCSKEWLASYERWIQAWNIPHCDDSTYMYMTIHGYHMYQWQQLLGNSTHVLQEIRRTERIPSGEITSAIGHVQIQVLTLASYLKNIKHNFTDWWIYKRLSAYQITVICFQHITGTAFDLAYKNTNHKNCKVGEVVAGTVHNILAHCCLTSLSAPLWVTYHNI